MDFLLSSEWTLSQEPPFSVDSVLSVGPRKGPTGYLWLSQLGHSSCPTHSIKEKEVGRFEYEKDPTVLPLITSINVVVDEDQQAKGTVYRCITYTGLQVLLASSDLGRVSIGCETPRINLISY